LNSPGSRRGVAVAAALLVSIAFTAHASAATGLTPQAPTNVRVESVYDAGQKHFINFIKWRESPDSVSTFVHQPDTTGWLRESSVSESSVPGARGAYSGDIDRTVDFRAIAGGTVGQDSITISYAIRREEYYSDRLVLQPSYVPNTWIPLTFKDQRTLTRVDFGLQIRFSAGHVDTQGGFILGLEDFEGYHVWRGIESDGSDLEVIGEVSKEEAFKGQGTGGSIADSVYFYDIVPTLRRVPHQPWFSPYGTIECLGTRIDLPLKSDQLFWFDCDAANGFTYYYAVTSFDRGYNPSSGQQGLVKIDNCTVEQDDPDNPVPYECMDQLVAVTMQSTPQNDLYNVYAVPNPFRSGSSRLTSDNYHNYPDEFIRFVNVPADCTIQVYTVAGDLVWRHTQQGGGGNIEWDTKNESEQPVASGVYVYRLEAPSGDSVYGRITIIR
jgi:hypothetical protein